MPTVHVHLTKDKTPALFRPLKNGSSIYTTDADDEEGRWVTINGAAVHIGKGGNIDKGPKELVGKSENGAHAHSHQEQSKIHSAAADAKGASHPDTPLHRKAAQAHAMAAHHFGRVDNLAEAGNTNAAGNVRRAAERDAATAKEKADELRKRNPEATEPKKQTEKPATHKALHSDAEDDVTGSEPHHAEHKRLLKEYDKAGADWQRHAINNQITKNASAAMKAKAATAHKEAITASKQAHETDETVHHKAAREAIDRAMEALEKSGNRSDDNNGDKIKELEKLRKPHHAKVLKEKKATEKAAMKGKPPAAGESDHDAMLQSAVALRKAGRHKEAAAMEQKVEDSAVADHAAKAASHAEQAAKLYKQGDKDASNAHDDAMRRHHEAIHAIRSTGDLNHERVRTAHEATRKLAAKPHKELSPPTKPKVWRSNRTGGHSAGSALEKIAGRTLKKAAEEAADQDPRHKK